MNEYAEYGKKFAAVKREVGKVIIGYDEVVEDFFICMMTGGHLLLEGVPGIAKTTLIKTFTKVMGLDYNRIQFTQDMLPADISGHYYYNQKKGEFELRRGPVFTQVLMADEINRAPPKTQSALIEAMQERQVTIEGTTIPLPEDFFVIATRNPIETEGVYPLPEAQLDRFTIKADMSYVTPKKELEILRSKNNGASSKVRRLSGDLSSSLHGLHKDVHVSNEILGYIRDIVIETRNVEDLILGASPRAGEQVLYASKAQAVLSGRSYVIPDDVKSVALRVLPHRMILTVDAELENIGKKEVVRNVLDDRVEAPKGDFKRA